MKQRIKVAELELREPIRELAELDGYATVQLLVRLHGVPVGRVTVPVVDGRCDPRTIASVVRRELTEPLVRELVHRRLAEPLTSHVLDIEALVDFTPGRFSSDPPAVSVAVCTRNRPEALAFCLDALRRLTTPAVEVIVVDNAPSDDATERLVRERFRDMRYVRELRPGLDWARNRAIAEARGEIIAFTDDDVIVDPDWVRALSDVFSDAPHVSAVTGLVVPYELETEAQQDFESYGGFGRGFSRRWHRAGGHHGAGRFGTGANMAFRRRLFQQIGLFDPALDVGTASDGGGDLEMFFRVLQEGHTLVYEPRAVVRHRHRPESARLRKQMRDWGTGFVAYMTRSARAYPGERWAFLSLASWWIRRRIVGPFLLSFVSRRAYPRDLIIEELRGALRSRSAYRRARRSAEQIARDHGNELDFALGREDSTWMPARAPRTGVAVRAVDLAEPLHPIDDIHDASAVRLYVLRKGAPIAMLEVPTGGQTLSVGRQRDLFSDIITRDLPKREIAAIREGMARWLMRGDTAPFRGRVSASPQAVDSVSIVIATFDRPDDLRRCLSGLVRQTTERRMEIIVVDNNPASRRTPPVVAEFPDVRLVSELRQGLSYARNAGIAVSSGAIVVAVDDDVVTPADWLDKLLVPFALADVMVVTGNVLPAKLETRAEQLFERYGGLGRGFERIEAGPKWFASWYPTAVPTWRLGATANAAFRATIFSHPEIGMLDPALGAGSPTGCSEDTDLFYRVLAAGFTIVYEPSAFVWHQHRSGMRALQRQLYAYSKGHVAYHLTTWLRHRDAGALIYLGYTLPKNHLKAIARWALRSRDYPMTLILTEIGGNLAGPWALWQARRRARRLGPAAGPPPAAVQRAEAAWSLAEEARDECAAPAGDAVPRPVGRQHSAMSSSDVTAASETDMRIA